MASAKEASEAQQSEARHADLVAACGHRLMPVAERPVLALDLAGAVAQAGIDPTLEARALQDALRRAIATRRGYCWWDVDHAVRSRRGRRSPGAGLVISRHRLSLQAAGGPRRLRTLEEVLEADICKAVVGEKVAELHLFVGIAEEDT